MSEINVQIGRRIRTFRKINHLTLNELSEIICKSKSTISKYEKGEISIDIETLYNIADALNIHVEQLLYYSPKENITYNSLVPVFFNNISQFYSYVFDGRANKLMRCVFDIQSETSNKQFKTTMYMNFKDFSTYQACENTYLGYMEHFDAVTNIALANQNMPMEKASVQILAAHLDSDTKWGLFKGFSSRPMMPVAAKMLVSKKPWKEDETLIEQLKISKEDIRLLKLYNMCCVM